MLIASSSVFLQFFLVFWQKEFRDVSRCTRGVSGRLCSVLPGYSQQSSGAGAHRERQISGVVVTGFQGCMRQSALALNL